MATNTILYEELNRAWKSTTLAYFGKEFGEIPDETYQKIWVVVTQHIVEEILKKGKDEQSANEAASEVAGETTVVTAEEATAADASGEAKA